MLQAVKSNLILYATDLCLMYQHKDIVTIRKILDEDFENICDWFVDKKLSINFGDDKTIRYKEIKVQPYKLKKHW